MTANWKSEHPGRPLRPQRGGTPSPENTVYRVRDVDRLYAQVAAGENVVLTAEKRIGKTAMVKLLRERSSDELVIVYRDVEGVGTPKRLMELLCQDLSPLLGRGEKAKQWLREVVGKLGGAEIGSISLPNFDPVDWRGHVNEVFDAVASQLAETDSALVVVWDEAPWMIDKVRRDCGWRVAADLLDELRQLRHAHPSIRFVFTGSIGFHHVLRDLRDGASHRPAINDMRQAELPTLTPENAGRLAWRLLLHSEGQGAEFASPPADIAERVAVLCDGIPWFIHSAVDDLAQIDEPITVEHVDGVVHAAKFSSNDSWGLQHYVERLRAYYGDQSELAGTTLDAVAARNVATVPDIRADLAHGGPPPSDDDIRRLLRLLEEDHYLKRTEDGWSFRYRVIRDGWRSLRGLEGA